MTADPAIEAYLARVAAALPGPGRARADVVAELRGGLLDATDTYRQAGHPAAAAAAVAEFGDPGQVAASFLPEFAARQARCLAAAVAAASMPAGLLWIRAVQASHPALAHGPLWGWVTAPPVPLAAAALLIAVVTALGAIAVTGRLTRWGRSQPRTAAALAATGGYGSAAANTAILVLLIHQIAVAPAALAPVPVCLATAASLASVMLACRFTRKGLATWAALRPRPSACLPSR